MAKSEKQDRHRVVAPGGPVFVGVLTCLVLMLLVYTAMPYVSPAYSNPEAEKGLAELANCRLHVSNLEASLKEQQGKMASFQQQQPRETLEIPSPGDGDTEGRKSVDPGGAEGGVGRRPQDDAAKTAEIQRLKEQVQSLLQEKQMLEAKVQAQTAGDGAASGAASAKVMQEAVEGAKKLLEGCNTVQPVQVSPSVEKLTSWKGYECSATKEDFDRYNNYKPGEICPNDWYFVQRLIFKKNCFVLPRRRCLSVTPPKPTEPLSLPDALFNQKALRDENVRWDLHQCKSYECLNTRTEGDCRNCFNLNMEVNRWKGFYRGAPPMKQVLDMKKGSIRLGLDVGGGTGSFAAHMATHGVTVLTTAFNVETVPGKKAGLPYMETIAQRGLVPLHWPHKARLPLYDGVLDIIHSVNSIKYIPPVEFQELIYEWDRVLRAGGLLWFEMFYAPVTEMPMYVGIIERMKYKKLYWNYTPKPDAGERGGEHVYLNCVLEKPARPGMEFLKGPSEADMDEIV